MFTDPQGKYRLSYTERINYNQTTGKPYSDFVEYIGIPYLKPTSALGGYEVYQVLPRAGGEYLNSADFFSPNQPFLTLTLETLDQDNITDIQAGQTLFSAILSTFKFLD